MVVETDQTKRKYSPKGSP